MPPDDAAIVSQGWIFHAYDLWNRAWKIARSHPGLDAAGIYRALRNLERSPEERLRRALSFGRLRSDRG